MSRLHCGQYCFVACRAATGAQTSGTCRMYQQKQQALQPSEGCFDCLQRFDRWDLPMGLTHASDHAFTASAHPDVQVITLGPNLLHPAPSKHPCFGVCRDGVRLPLNAHACPAAASIAFNSTVLDCLPFSGVVAIGRDGCYSLHQHEASSTRSSISQGGAIQPA